MKIHRTPHQLIEIRAIDGDTLEAWLEYDQLVRIRVLIRLPGIEGGERGTTAGERSWQMLQTIIDQFHTLSATLATHPRVRDNHGRIVSDVLFGTGQSLCGMLLLSGSYWRRGARKPPAPPGADSTNQ